TATLASGLGLSRSWGTIISDIAPGGAAEATGLQVGDIILAIDGKPILGRPDFINALYLHPTDQVLKIDVLRGIDTRSFNVAFKLNNERIGAFADKPDLQKSLVPRLNTIVT